MGSANSSQGILLESGTNELEVLVFSCGPTRYGVNVAKVREVVGTVKITSVPKTHEAIIGVFKLRDRVIPLVDLQLYFHPGKPSVAAQRSVILMEFNDMQIGFLVDQVERIYRMSWNSVRPMPLVRDDETTVITSVCDVDGKLVLMVDFEKIAFDVNGASDVFRVHANVSEEKRATREAQHVMFAEDSPTVRAAVRTNLDSAGYTAITCAANGQEAWDLLLASLNDQKGDPYTIVVTDIEMPQMDGLHLCKKVKEHPQLNHLPVVVFSSLVSDGNLKKCKSVGADAAITKPQMARVVDLLDDLLGLDTLTDATSNDEKVLAMMEQLKAGAV